MPQCSTKWKISIPSTLINLVTQWYHLHRGHVGTQCLYATISMHFFSPQLKAAAENLVKQCDTCQQFKLARVGRGELPPKNLTAQPWDEVCVNLIVPWTIKINGNDLEFLALTAIDPVTKL
jgi:Integrase zinc binding domain